MQETIDYTNQEFEIFISIFSLYYVLLLKNSSSQENWFKADVYVILFSAIQRRAEFPLPAEAVNKKIPVGVGVRVLPFLSRDPTI